MSKITGSRLLLVLGCLASGLAHSAACAALGRAPRAREPLPPSRVEFQIAAAKPESAPEAEPAIHPEPAPNPEPARPRPVAAEPRSATPPAAVHSQAPADTVDLRGLTLTADPGQGSFATLAGNGQSFDGPLGPGGRAAAPAPAPVSSALPRAAASSGPALVALGDLSSRPVAPELGSRLLDFYPAEAKRRGIAGTAQVRARIDPDGRVRAASVLGETFDGFGSACRRTLLGSVWSAPRDRDGRAVATEIRYTCRFVVQP